MLLKVYNSGKKKYWYLYKIILLYEKANVTLEGEVHFEIICPRHFQICSDGPDVSAKLWFKSWVPRIGTYYLCNRATFAFQIHMNSKSMIKQSEIFNISLFSLTIFIFKMLNLNVSSLLLCIQWLWHWLNLVITAN